MVAGTSSPPMGTAKPRKSTAGNSDGVPSPRTWGADTPRASTFSTEGIEMEVITAKPDVDDDIDEGVPVGQGSPASVSIVDAKRDLPKSTLTHNIKDAKRCCPRDPILLFTRSIARTPFLSCCTMVFLMWFPVMLSILLMGVGVDVVPFEGEVPLQLREHDSLIRYHAYLSARDTADASSTTPQSQTTREIPEYFMNVMYDGRGENILTQEFLNKMRSDINDIVSKKGYTDYCTLRDGACVSPVSIITFFDAAGDSGFNNVTNVLKDVLASDKKSNLLALVDEGFGQYNLYSNVTYCKFTFGGPLAGYESIEHKSEEQQKKVEEFLADTYYADIVGKADGEADIANDLVRVLCDASGFRLSFIFEAMFKDFSLAIGSITFVSIFMVMQTGSPFITFWGLFQILMAFPSANLVYRFIFQIKYFGIFNILAVFIILGIGADDIFVFLDTWKQSSHLPSDVVGDLGLRMSVAYKHAARAMFVTSLTTMLSFAANATSTLEAVRSFGIFAALLVIVNYLFVISFFPMVVLVHHKYVSHFEKRVLQCICLPYHHLKASVRRHRELIKSNALEDEEPVDADEALAVEDEREENNDRSIRRADTSSGSLNRRKPLISRIFDTFGPLPVNRLDNRPSTKVSKAIRQAMDYKMRAAALKKRVEQNALRAERLEERANKLELRGSDLQTGVLSDTAAPLSDDDALQSRPSLDSEEVMSEISATATKLGCCARLKKKFIFVGNAQFHSFRGNTIEKLLHAYYAPWLVKWKYHILAGFVMFLIVCMAFAGTLRADNDAGNLFADGNNFSIYDTIFKDQLTQSRPPFQVSVLFGIDGIDREGTNPTDPSDIGDVIWNDKVNLHSEGAQQGMYDLCTTGFNEGDHRNLKIRNNEIGCFMVDFRTWALVNSTSSTFPVPEANFTTDLLNFLEYNDFEAFGKYGGLMGGDRNPDKVLYYGFFVNTTVEYEKTTFEEGIALYDSWERWFDHISKQDFMQPLWKGYQFTNTPFGWHGFFIQQILLQSAFLSIFLSLVLAFLIISISTGNWIISLFAVVSILCVVIGVLGFIVAYGWQLGVLESINLVLVVGMSVDYVVHLAESYMHAKGTREERVLDSLSSTGISVLSGAFSTLGSAVFMFAAIIIFFLKFAAILATTIFLSLFFSLGFFMALCAAFGPEYPQGDLAILWRLMVRHCRKCRNARKKE